VALAVTAIHEYDRSADGALVVTALHGIGIAAPPER
jgi:hypothetical protein